MQHLLFATLILSPGLVYSELRGNSYVKPYRHAGIFAVSRIRGGGGVGDEFNYSKEQPNLEEQFTKCEEVATELWAKDGDIATEILGVEQKRERLVSSRDLSNDFITTGLEFAEQRSFFNEARRLVLLTQSAMFFLLGVWQSLHLDGGLASFIGADKWPSSTGLAVALGLYQCGLFTSIFVFFGCNRTVHTGIKFTGVQSLVVLMYLLKRIAMGTGLGLYQSVVIAWLCGMIGLCSYYGRQL